MKKIGIIGGMGPQATIDLFQYIVSLRKVTCDQDNIPLLIDNNTAIPDRTSYIINHSAPNPTQFLIQSAKSLEEMGASAIIMPCNTAHYFAAVIEENINIPLLHIVDETIDYIEEKNLGKQIALIATEGTRQSKIYDTPLRKLGYEIEAFSKAQQALINDIIYKGGKTGNLETYSESFNELLASIKAPVAILACTELPLFLPLLKTDKALVNPTEILAQAAINYSLSK